jgi:hypothetical protein
MGAVAVVLVLVIVWALLVPGADWLARHDVGSAKGSLSAARDAARGRLLTLGAGLLAAGALLFTARNFVLSREGQVTDRYTKAIEQLGSDKLDVRIGGIYALERIARDSAKDHPTVMEVLTAFIREHSREDRDPSLREQWDPSEPDSAEPPRPDIQAAITVVGRRDAKRDIQPVDFTRACLRGATLVQANLFRANLFRANLFRADLSGANLLRADLSGANLREADLTGGDLQYASLGDANLECANLECAELTGADFTRANLHDVILTGAYLAGANFTDADIDGVEGARLSDRQLEAGRGRPARGR